MRVASILLLAVLGLAAHAAWADEALGLSDEALLAPLSQDEPLGLSGQQRSVLADVTAPPYYCANSHIKDVFTVKIAFLMKASGKRKVITSGDGLNLFRNKVKRRLTRYNRRYKLNLTYTVIQKTSGRATLKKQKWFYYDIKFVIGKCGKYKYPLITQLRGDIQPVSRYIRLVRVLDYPAFIKK